jgi:predicted DNA-binding transcriptional regulator YafY
VEFDYTDEQGRHSHRRAESYTLHQTTAGNIVLGAFDLHRMDRRSFRVDWMRRVRVSSESFAPRYAIEMGLE